MVALESSPSDDMRYPKKNPKRRFKQRTQIIGALSELEVSSERFSNAHDISLYSIDEVAVQVHEDQATSEEWANRKDVDEERQKTAERAAEAQKKAEFERGLKPLRD